MKALGRLYQRRYPPQGGYTTEQARELALISRDIGRQVGLLIDRQGRTEKVIVGEPGSILIHDTQRARVGSGRLRGLRFLHTHLRGEPLSREDLNDLLSLRLDSLAALTVGDWGEPEELHYAHVLPTAADDPGRSGVSAAAPLPWDRVDVDFGALVQALEDEMGRQVQTHDSSPDRRALLVSVGTEPRREQEASLAELAALAKTAGLEVAGTMIQRVERMNPKTILGSGKIADLEVEMLQSGAGVVVFDRELLPAQQHNLADLTERMVLDRTQLILDIFAQHATTKAGKLQVEMAQLKYAQPRLVKQNKALSRLAGGIGGRGPGESKLEHDKRKIKERIGRINDELKKLRKQRAAVRARREKCGVPLAALVGYTNTGKSTLLNTLTQSRVLTEDKLFATLDPTTRRLRFPHERELILTDTVGFIRQLPKSLREAFRATLEELEAADLLVHVADASHPELEEQIRAVEDILFELELGDIPRILVLNKVDRLDDEARRFLANRRPEAVLVSARDRRGLDELSAAIVRRIDWDRDWCEDRLVEEGEDAAAPPEWIGDWLDEWPEEWTEAGMAAQSAFTPESAPDDRFDPYRTEDAEPLEGGLDGTPDEFLAGEDPADDSRFEDLSQEEREEALSVWRTH